MNRRKFIKNTLTGSALIAFSSGYQDVFASNQRVKLTILHTNDVHSRIDPFPMDDIKYAGMGGVAPRTALIKKIRQEEEHVLLLDAGDIFQGTPYFNIYKGEPEIRSMSEMGYDAGTMGNHDFDAGLENFATQLHHAEFPVILCNYDFTGTPMEFKYQPYKIFRKGKLKIGVTGVGIEMAGLVPQALIGNTKYLDPVANANMIADKLKKDKGCDMVICLSHLGYKYKDDREKISDTIFAAETENIDLIIGGHTHTFLDDPVLLKNKSGSDVLINQVGWAGLRLGRLDYEFNSRKTSKISSAQSVIVSKQTSG